MSSVQLKSTIPNCSYPHSIYLHKAGVAVPVSGVWVPVCTALDAAGCGIKKKHIFLHHIFACIVRRMNEGAFCFAYVCYIRVPEKRDAPRNENRKVHKTRTQTNAHTIPKIQYNTYRKLVFYLTLIATI